MSAFSLHRLGRVALVQVQAASLKVGRRPDSRYDPAPLTPVERLVVTPGGVIGITNDGREIVDVHHADHSESRQGRDGRNGVSVGFASHYQTIRARFGEHLGRRLWGRKHRHRAGRRRPGIHPGRPGPPACVRRARQGERERRSARGPRATDDCRALYRVRRLMWQEARR
jgi:hypothetical protein